MLEGDEDRWGVIKEGVKTKAQEFLPTERRLQPVRPVDTGDR